MDKVRNIFLECKVGDVEDPDWYANMEIASWATKNPEAHQYLMEKSDGDMRIHRKACEPIMGHSYEFSAEMLEQDWAYYYLRFDDVSRHQYS